MTSLASDSFTGTDGTAWSASTWTTGSSPTGSSATIVGNAGRLTTGTGTSGSARVARRVNITAPADAVVLFKFRWPTGDECYPRWYVRSTNTSLDSQGGYWVELNRPAGQMSIGKGSSYTNATLPTGTSADLVTKSFSANTWYWCRFGVVGTALKARVWLDGTAEPSSWDVTATDSSISSAGSGTGITLGTGSVQNGKFDVDELSLDSAFPVATVLGPTATSSMTAPAGTVGAGRSTVGPTATGSLTAPAGTVAAIYTVAGPPIVSYINALAGAAGIGAFANGLIASGVVQAQAGEASFGSTKAAPPASNTLVGHPGLVVIPAQVAGPMLGFTTAAVSGAATGQREHVRIGSANIQIAYRNLLDGAPCTGTVRFTPTAYIAADELLVPNRVAVTLDADGLLDVDLPVGKDQLTLPLVAYLVEERLDAPSFGRPPFYLLLTPADDGTTVQLATVPLETNVPDLALYMLKAGGSFTGPVTVASTFDVTGNTSLGANLTVQESAVVGSLDVDENADVEGSLSVGGSVIVNESVEASYVSAPAYSGGSFDGAITVHGGANIEGDTVLGSNLTVGANITVTGAFVGAVKVPGAVTLTSLSNAPAATTGAGNLFVQAGILKYVSPSGTVTTVAPA
ncbi:hypothetical protein [Kineosporia succinea]|uniref:Cytoskeletal protein CcmA (Bactofilin family) n=1 Tax=Kineosporia succinea TaxID=84632 RepID=A0ABT9NYB1_9ACTN|nr:hypothetical protein [Kineosporia succinea]MDP9825242.1 cytoskeletal protein CcmA (bactofilin family) [Kineosporia succinea]